MKEKKIFLIKLIKKVDYTYLYIIYLNFIIILYIINIFFISNLSIWQKQLTAPSEKLFKYIYILIILENNQIKLKLYHYFRNNILLRIIIFKFYNYIF